jgi:hypothetical protein
LVGAAWKAAARPFARFNPDAETCEMPGMAVPAIIANPRALAPPTSFRRFTENGASALIWFPSLVGLLHI